MVKKRIIFFLIAFKSSLGVGFEKLPTTYHISYGNPNAPIQVVEYFSFACPKCLKLIREDFEVIEKKYIDTGKVYWVFHPDPADKLTLQAMICLEKLDAIQKRLFLDVLSANLEGKSFSVGCAMMQAAMEHFKKPLSELDKMDFLETTDGFRKAFAFLKQKDVIQNVPTVEINGSVYDEFPSLKFLERQFNSIAGDAPQCK